MGRGGEEELEGLLLDKKDLIEGVRDLLRESDRAFLENVVESNRDLHLDGFYYYLLLLQANKEIDAELLREEIGRIRADLGLTGEPEIDVVSAHEMIHCLDLLGGGRSSDALRSALASVFDLEKLKRPDYLDRSSRRELIWMMRAAQITDHLRTDFSSEIEPTEEFIKENINTLLHSARVGESRSTREPCVVSLRALRMIPGLDDNSAGVCIMCQTPDGIKKIPFVFASPHFLRDKKFFLQTLVHEMIHVNQSIVSLSPDGSPASPPGWSDRETLAFIESATDALALLRTGSSGNRVAYEAGVLALFETLDEGMIERKDFADFLEQINSSDIQEAVRLLDHHSRGSFHDQFCARIEDITVSSYEYAFARNAEYRKRRSLIESVLSEVG